LIKAARLETRRHQKEIAPGLDPMRQPLVETDFHGDLVGKNAGRVCGQALSNDGSPLPSKNELQCAVASISSSAAKLDVHAFLFRQPGDAANNGVSGRAGRLNSKLQIRFLRGFAIHAAN